MKNPLVINIQKCSIHDGPGIRTTIFFKGCPLKCTWCHNPESKSYNKEVLHDINKCSKCNLCINNCENKAIYFEKDRLYQLKEKCTFCEVCLDYCLNNAREIVGREYSVSELIKEIEKDMIFYEQSNGGVTLSGGEVMTQDINYIYKLLKNCKSKGIHTAIDTCGYVKYENFDKILGYTDLFLYDIKLLNKEKHIEYTGLDNDLIIENLKQLSDIGANINIRIPLIEGINLDESNKEIKDIIKLLSTLNIKQVNLLPYHEIGSYKYEKLNLQYDKNSLKRPSDEKTQEIKELFEANNFITKVGG